MLKLKKPLKKTDEEWVSELQDILEVLAAHMTDMGKVGLLVQFSFNNTMPDNVTVHTVQVRRDVPIPVRNKEAA